MEDDKIIERYLNRDESAISETRDKYGSRLRALAQGIVADHATAEECENDVYLQTWDSIPPHEPRSYFFAFLARITRHIALNCCRSRGALKRQADIAALSEEMEQCIPASNDTALAVDGILLCETLSAFLRKQPEEKRKIFMRRYWYMDSIADIAARSGMQQSRVKTMLFRMRNDLREYLTGEGYTI